MQLANLGLLPYTKQVPKAHKMLESLTSGSEDEARATLLDKTAINKRVVLLLRYSSLLMGKKIMLYDLVVNG